MKKEIALHFFSFIVFFALVFLFRFLITNSFTGNPLNYWSFWLGGVVGTILPDIDHLIYVYYLKPYELTSQRVAYMAKKGQLLQSWHFLATTRNERTRLILHTATFQFLFIILSFLVTTSSSSLLGRGLVLGFLLHLIVDLVLDLKNVGHINNWFHQIQFTPDKTQTYLHVGFNVIAILIFAFLF